MMVDAECLPHLHSPDEQLLIWMSKCTKAGLSNIQNSSGSYISNV